VSSSSQHHWPYGAAGSGSTIPPNSPLVFVVDLLGVH